MIVYKYVGPQRIDVLKLGLIRFTQPADLNDPFEAFPNLSAFIECVAEELLADSVKNFGKQSQYATPHLVKFIIETNIKHIVEVLGENFVTLSLSRCNSNLLMWAHYTDSHRGLVIGFDSNDDFFLPGKGKSIEGLRPVHYSMQRVVLPANLELSNNPQNGKLSTDAYFFTKSIDWSYEQEMRILAHPSFADKTIPQFGTNNLCLFRFPPTAVKEIILGSNMPIDLIVETVDIWRTTYPSARIGFSSLSLHEFKVDVNFVHNSRYDKLLEFTTTDTLSWLLHACFS